MKREKKTKGDLIKEMFNERNEEDCIMESYEDNGSEIIVHYKIYANMYAEHYTVSEFTTFVYNRLITQMFGDMNDNYGVLDMD